MSEEEFVFVSIENLIMDDVDYWAVGYDFSSNTIDRNRNLFYQKEVADQMKILSSQALNILS